MRHWVSLGRMTDDPGLSLCPGSASGPAILARSPAARIGGREYDRLKVPSAVGPLFGEVTSQSSEAPMIFVGIDVSAKRGCGWAAIDASYETLKAGWVNPDSDKNVCASVLGVLRGLGEPTSLVVGIDAPRQPLEFKRRIKWHQTRGWIKTEPLIGRHAELVIRALNLANPQWTPQQAVAPPWMRLGFELFRQIVPKYQTMEVFPTASFTQLKASTSPKLTLDFRAFSMGPKDILDAYTAAVTVAEFAAGRGSEVGGGDRLGTIVLPKPIAACDRKLLEWPGKKTGSSY